MSDTIITTATYHPSNPHWPAVLRIRLVAAMLPAKPHQLGYVWTAVDAGNGDKDATVNAASLAPKRVYTTRDAAIAAAKKDGWEVTSDTLAASLGRKGGQAKTPAKAAAITAAIAAANARSDERYRVANEFPALGDAVATYHANEDDATEAAAGLIASLADDIMAWGELTPVAPTGDAAEVAAMREAYDLAASASEDAINNAGIARMTREAAELIAARAVSITRVNA